MLSCMDHSFLQALSLHSYWLNESWFLIQKQHLFVWYHVHSTSLYEKWNWIVMNLARIYYVCRFSTNVYGKNFGKCQIAKKMEKDAGLLPLCAFRSGITTSFGNPCNLEEETCPYLVFYNKLKKILVLSPISGTSLYKHLFHSLVLAGFGLFVSFQTLVQTF